MDPDEVRFAHHRLLRSECASTPTSVSPERIPLSPEQVPTGCIELDLNSAVLHASNRLGKMLDCSKTELRRSAMPTRQPGT